MRKRLIMALMSLTMISSLITGCGNKSTQPGEKENEETVEASEDEGITAPSADVYLSDEMLNEVNSADYIELYKQVTLTATDMSAVEESEDTMTALANSTTYDQEEYYYTKLSLKSGFEKTEDFLTSTVFPETADLKDVYGVNFDDVKTASTTEEAFETLLNGVGISTTIIPGSLNEALFTDYGQVTYELEGNNELYKKLLGDVDESLVLRSATEVTMEEQNGTYVPTEYFVGVYWMDGDIEYARTLAIMISYTNTSAESQALVYHVGDTMDADGNVIKADETTCGCGCGGALDSNTDESSCACGSEDCTDETSPCGPEHGCYTDENGVMHCGDDCQGACCTGNK